MKRSQLHKGMQVELQRGRDYPTFTTNVIVLDTELWQLNARWGTGECFASPDSMRRSGREISRGIPVAVREARYLVGDDHRYVYEDDEPILLGYEWVPRFVRAQDIVPAGTQAAHQTARDAATERTHKIRAQRDERNAAIRERCGGLQVHIRDHEVLMAHDEFEKLLTEAGR